MGGRNVTGGSRRGRRRRRRCRCRYRCRVLSPRCRRRQRHPLHQTPSHRHLSHRHPLNHPLLPPRRLTNATFAGARAKQTKVTPVPITTMSPAPSPPRSPKPARPHISPPPSPPPSPPHVSPPPSPPPQPEDDAQSGHGGSGNRKSRTRVPFFHPMQTARSTPYAQTFASKQARTDPYAGAPAPRQPPAARAAPPATGQRNNAGVGGGGGAQVRNKAGPDPASTKHRFWAGPKLGPTSPISPNNPGWLGGAPGMQYSAARAVWDPRMDYGADRSARGAVCCCHPPYVWAPVPCLAAHYAVFNQHHCAGCPACGLHH